MFAFIGVNETFEKFEDNFNQSSIGRAVSTVNDSRVKNYFSIQEAYLQDFCTFHISSMENHLFQVIFNINLALLYKDRVERKTSRGLRYIRPITKTSRTVTLDKWKAIEYIYIS